MSTDDWSERERALLQGMTTEQRIAFAETGMDEEDVARMYSALQKAADNLKPVFECFDALGHNPPQVVVGPPRQPELHPSGLNRKQRRKYIGGVK